MTPATLNLTPARYTALAAVARAGPRLPARVSNVTRIERPVLVYWQSAEWLVEQGLVTTSGPIEHRLYLTDAGRTLCADLGIEVRP